MPATLERTNTGKQHPRALAEAEPVERTAIEVQVVPSTPLEQSTRFTWLASILAIAVVVAVVAISLAVRDSGEPQPDTQLQLQLVEDLGVSEIEADAIVDYIDEQSADLASDVDRVELKRRIQADLGVGSAEADAIAEFVESGHLSLD